MLLPAQYAWFEPVLVATIVVFIIDLAWQLDRCRQPLPQRPNECNRICTRVRSSCLFRLRQCVDVSDIDAKCNCPRSNAKIIHCDL
jgi:hypothetical protein